MAAEKPLILFVHAAFHRPIHYNAVLNSLRDKNFTVIAPELPSTGTDPTLTYADDVDVLNSALEPLLDRGKEVVVVAHDFGALAASHCIEGESVSERAECGLGGGIRHYINVCGLSYPEMGRNIVGKREDFPLPDYYHVEVSYIHVPKRETQSSDRRVPDFEGRTAWCICSTRRNRCYTATSRRTRSRRYGPAS